RPDAIAVVDEDGALSYGRLDEASSRLAGYLESLGIGPGSRVGVSMRRSADLVTALLGILKIGAAYVPLDPGYPDERLAFLREDAGLAVVLTVPLSGEIAPPRQVPSESLAYVIYTSGSTGTPKGVAVSHRAVLRLVMEASHLTLHPGDRLAFNANTSFDAATFEIWATLLAGATLVVIPQDLLLSPPDLAMHLERENVTVLHLTAALFAQAVPAALSRLRCALFGGEASAPAAVARVLEGGRPQRLLHMYGPTESTTFATWSPLVQIEPDAATLPIGRPLANTTAYVLDRRQQLVPPGVAGELCLGGDGLAWGYLNRPELTAERFVPDPFGEPGARLYRTGDLASVRGDGTLELQGRIDHQVKIRGFRIEPGEVEAALAGHPAVRECAVVARQNAGVRLVAYVVGEVGDLRDYLRARLPDYMVPSAFVTLEALPLTPNGKVDRKALPAPESAGSAAAPDLAHPADPVAELLVGIWAEVLGLGRVGVDDDFFALGGHSLLATQVISRVRAVFGVELPLRRLFESPTVAGLAQAVRESREDRPAPPIVPVPREAGDSGLPLSFAQQRLWLLDQLEPGSAAYNMPLAVRLAHEVDPVRLTWIFAEIVRRHEALRTTFTSREGRPVQVIAPGVTGLETFRVELPVIDLSQGSETEAFRLAREEARRPFDLEKGPLLRLTLLRLGARDHVLLLTMHHIVSDGWSMGVLLREVGLLSAGSPLPELPVQYADFAVWQRGWLQGEVLEGQLAYWQRQLDGVPQALELPPDRPRPAVQTYRGAALLVALEPPLSEAVRAICRREGATPFMALLASWAVVLGRHAGQEDILVGTPVAGRNRREVEGLIGFFVNTLVLRADLSGSPGFAALLARVRQTALDGYTYQDVPFERLVEELAPERDLSRSPLFQVMLALQNAPSASLSRPGLALQPLAVDNGLTKFDLTLSLQEGPAGFEGSLSYSTDLFDRGTAARLWSRFAALLAAAVASPEVPVSELPLLLPAERHQALVEWNDSARSYGPGLCLHERVSSQARRTPDAVALSCEGRELSYGELERRANRLAHHLIGLGVAPDGRVGVRLERSPEMIVALLGVLKTGAAYVPLDPSYPAARLAALVAGSGARVVLTRESWEEIGSRPATAPAVRTAEDNLAYVLFTSGSTGTPKGVMVPHRGIVNRLLWEQEAFALTPEDRFLQKTPFTFDVSVWEVFWPLLNGARLVLARPGGHQDPAYLAGLIAREGITAAHFVPSMLQAFLEVAEAPDLSSLRLVMAGGEALPVELVRRLLHRVPQVGMFNRYGPTEASVSVSVWRCEPDANRAISPIGRPVANLRLCVMDRELRLQPPGVPGELLLGGAGLARGYLGRPDLTAAAFVPDPLGPFGDGERLYRTGDLARTLPDGTVEFLGRIDHQVKVRGFRIELGEIEAVLASHPGVRECAVLVREDVPGSRLLVAYVAGPAETGELKAFLTARLPEYMVPAVFVVLDALPSMTSGKVDRRALSATAAPERQGAAGPDEPRDADPIEELLSGIWSEVLGLNRIGIHEDFFALGGHSLLATQVISRVRTVVGVELPLRRLFEAPTIAELARAVREGREGRPAPPIVPVPRDVPGGELPLSFAQQRLWLLDQLEPGSPAYNIPTAVRLTGELPAGRLGWIFAEVARRHEALRTTFASRDGQAVQVIASSGPELPVVDLSGLAAREELARRLALEEAWRPFDLARGPLLRLTLLRLGETDHLLLMTMHHIVSDGWSRGVLLREIGALYAGSPLPELPVQYADFAVWQRSWLQGEVLEEQIAYWRRRLEGAPRVLELPADRSRPAVQTFRGASQWASLSSTLSERVRELCRREGATPFMALLAVWSVLLGRHAAQEDVLVGTPIAGRNRREIEGLIGFFVNTLVLRADLSDAPGFGALLARVRQTALEAYTHQDLPFDRLVEELAPERDLSRPPLFQVVFTLQNAPGGGLRLPDLALAPVDLENRTTKFELSLGFQESAGGFAGVLEYNTDLFDATTAARLLARFEALLEGAAETPGRALQDLPLMLPAERQQALLEWNDTRSGYPRESSLPELFQAMARSFPEAPAIVSDAEVWSYRRLDEASNRLARRLRSLGVGLETAVAVSMERSPELVAGILAVLKAGGVYVPLDADYPDERLAFMLADTGAEVALVHRSTQDRLQGRARLLLTVDELILDAGDGGPLDVEVPAEGLAYVSYTSGSTGRPKGVAVPHRAVVRLVRETDYVRLGRGDRTAFLSNISFDAATFDLWAALLNGG
ncbi:MAG TPA: amino acid adenylation domain-containing protein, partial [Thermoanaerobaculia bacterium]|nr:amino acid adenylation domain-containing protein [Thermoanaerobaculia bacterium]